MQLAQKISVSIDPAVMGFMQSYQARYKVKSRSALVNQALKLLEQREKENALDWAYRQSAPSDLIVAQEFASFSADGLTDEAW